MAYQAQYDVNGDAMVNQYDVTYEVTHYLLTNYGDDDLNSSVDFNDFDSIQSNWQYSGPFVGWLKGDFNGDCIVDFLDFQIMLDYWNPAAFDYGPSQAPEPATVTLLAMGGFAILRSRSGRTHQRRMNPNLKPKPACGSVEIDAYPIRKGNV